MMAVQGTESKGVNVGVAPLEESDLPEADRVFRVAFGTFLGLPDPGQFHASADYVRTRWRASPSSAFAAKLNDQLIGSVFAAKWGSVGLFGPLTVRPDCWDKGVGKSLLGPVMDLFGKWDIKHAGLFTFAQSTKHVALYQKFGFWPRYLTAVMSKPVSAIPDPPPSRYGGLDKGGRENCLAACNALTGAIFQGLSVEWEISAVASQQLGDTVLLWDDGRLVGFGICHCGEGTEAGQGSCYVKFGAVQPGPGAEIAFHRLLKGCERYAATRGLSRLVAGVNLARHAAYRGMLEAGFRTDFQGVAMQKPNEAGYNRPEALLIDDWR
jgi:GNAT superfamily N-acetyltransferase